MKINKIKDFTKGWFVGDFDPSLIKTNQFEVGFKKYKKGDSEDKHYHKIATEITVIVYGTVKMNGTIYKKDDVITMNPGDATDFLALEDAACLVIKTPSLPNDKYED